MPIWICRTCGNHFPETDQPPTLCPICSYDRQYLPPGGQQWVTPGDIAARHEVSFSTPEPGVHRMEIEPGFAIGQRTALIRTTAGNLLWEPSGLLTEAMISQVTELGGVAAIAASHPHLVGASVAWSQAFDHVPIYANGDDQAWITRPDPATTLWTDRVEVLPGLQLIQTGGHFPGSAVAHWSGAEDGRGVLFSGDTIAPGPDGWCSFMRSYPNLIPLPERSVGKIISALAGVSFDRIYGAFAHAVGTDAEEVLAASARRYIGWLTDALRDPGERL